MSMIGSVKAKYEGIKETYRFAVDNQNATVYESSMLYTQDNAFQEFFTSKIKLGLETFSGDLRKIDTNPDNYNYKNTGDKKQELIQVITNASATIFKYTEIIKEKSKEVFDEYTTKFESSNRLYEGAKESALKHINLAQDAQNNIDNNPHSTTKLNDTGGYVPNPEYYDYKRRWEDNRDRYLRAAESQLDVMEKNIKSMKETLDKGLKKV